MRPGALDVDAVLALLEASRAMPYIGEGVSQLEHALQCAERATRAGASEATIAAALLHDIGHLSAAADAPRMDGLGVMNHELVGGAFLEERGFPITVVRLVQSHVSAKRYLVSKHPDYRANLSAASAATLAFQGGPMTLSEATAFEQTSEFRDALRLRAWDEQAKESPSIGPVLADYRPLLLGLAR